jgi:predicted DNA-binding transcriptional regulator AlpA
MEGVGVVRLDVESVDAIARRVAEILRAEPDHTRNKLITAAEVAARFGVSRTWVYDNAEPLGVIRLGTGAKARLRFDPAQVLEFIEAKRSSHEDTVRQSPPSATRWLDAADLIPIRGQ